MTLIKRNGILTDNKRLIYSRDMTDPLHCGDHCSVETCKRLDFLPFTCDRCHGTFCKEHASPANHQCSNHCETLLALSVWEPSQGRESVQEGGTVGRAPPCWVRGCGRREQVEVICLHCSHRLCLVHRHPEDHACPSLPLSSTGTNRGGRMAESVGALPNTKKSAGGMVGAKSGTLSAKVALMKMKQKADGPESIPQSERVYFDVRLPAGCPVASAPLFFSKEWSVGKVVDTISRKFRLSNQNDLSDSKRLLLYTSDGSILLPSRPLHSYLDLLPSGSSVTLDYEH